MVSRLSLFLIALALPISFPAQSAKSLRQRYGQPISETFLVRPGIAVSASYAASRTICELVISRKQDDGMMKRWPGSEPIDNSVLQNIEDELVPIGERGKFKMSAFMDVTCLPENDCQGSMSSWEKVGMYINVGTKGSRYETIRWNRAECAQKDGRDKSK